MQAKREAFREPGGAVHQKKPWENPEGRTDTQNGKVKARSCSQEGAWFLCISDLTHYIEDIYCQKCRHITNLYEWCPNPQVGTRTHRPVRGKKRG